MAFGDRLATALALADESRDSLARELGISVQAISQVITGVTKAMTAENALKASRFLGVNPYWLATGKESPRGLTALRQTLSDEAIEHAVKFEQMSDHERLQLVKLMEVAVEGRRQHLGGVSGFDKLTGRKTGSDG